MLRGSMCSTSEISGNSVSVETIGSSRMCALPRWILSKTFSASYCERRSAAASITPAVRGTSSMSLLVIAWRACTAQSRFHSSSMTCWNSILVATDVFGVSIASMSTLLASQSSAFSSARMTSRSRCTLSVQSLLYVFLCSAIGLIA